MAFLSLYLFVTALSCGHYTISTVGYVPQVTLQPLVGRITSTTVMLALPFCYFDTVPGLPCPDNSCQIWCVIASGQGVNNFDAQRNSSQILSTSPYPSAFYGAGNKSYFITMVGIMRDLPCIQLPGIRYFRIGSEGNCTGMNCNGVLPAGAHIRVKYILIDLQTNLLVSESNWSQTINLIAPMASSSIDVSFGRHSGGMIVITVITSCMLVVLLLALAVVLLLDQLGYFQRIQKMTSEEYYEASFKEGTYRNTCQQTCGCAIISHLSYT